MSGFGMNGMTGADDAFLRDLLAATSVMKLAVSEWWVNILPILKLATIARSSLSLFLFLLLFRALQRQ